MSSKHICLSEVNDVLLSTGCIAAARTINNKVLCSTTTGHKQTSCQQLTKRTRVICTKNSSYSSNCSPHTWQEAANKYKPFTPSKISYPSNTPAPFSNLRAAAPTIRFSCLCNLSFCSSICCFKLFISANESCSCRW
jgi:hypothetical protein